MRKITNLKEIKEVFHTFLYLPINKTPYYPMTVDHPVFDSGVLVAMENGKPRQFNICEDDNDFKFVVDKWIEIINDCNTLDEIIMYIRKPYKLAFLKYCKSNISREDFSRVFGDVWVQIENGNQDVNVSINQLISWFKSCDKNFLMEEGEREYLNSLPDEITVYRGVGEGRNPKGLSWTNDYDLAMWFAKRWQRSGHIIKGKVKKEDVFAYFSDRVNSGREGYPETELVVPYDSVYDREIVYEFKTGDK